MSADVSIEYTVKVSYMEIYMEKIKDLLQRELRLPLILVKWDCKEADSLQLPTTTCQSTKTRHAAYTSKG
jgi:kinesin family protein 5